jgi:hypothetical protein
VEAELDAAWRTFLTEGGGDGVFSPRRAEKAPPGTEWPAVSVNAALADPDRMALQQYGGCSRILAEGGGACLAVRCNYGTGILPSLFGAPIHVMDEALNTLPTARPLAGPDALRQTLDRGVPDLRAGYGEQVLAMGRTFAEIGEAYPSIGRYVRIYHPDTQGPMDVVELLYGSDLFYALYEEPELVRQLLDLVTETYIAFLREWETVVPFAPDYNVHHLYMHRGAIVLRDDSAMNLSPAMFDEFIRPWDQRLLTEFGGGVVHFCGRGDHYIESLCGMADLTGVNLSQPELNDMETVFAATVDRGIPLLGFNRAAAEAALAAGRDLQGRVHCF